MLSSTFKITVVALMAALIVLVGITCVWMETLNRVTAELPIVADKAIAREGLLTRLAAERQITAVSTKLDQQVTALRTDLFTRVDTLEADAFQQIDQVRIDANQQIADTRTAAVNEISRVATPAGATIANLQSILPPAQHILANARQTSDLLLDCDHNPDCLPNRVIPAMKNFEHMAAAGQNMANSIAEATPATAKAVQSTSQDLAKVVKKFSQPVSWMKSMAGTAATVIGKFLSF
jgi:methyl-accepting chemotaxis protein